MGEHKGERWAAIEPIYMQMWDDGQMRPTALLLAQKLIEERAEEQDVELNHETWQILEPVKFNGEYIDWRTDDGVRLPNAMLIRVEGVGR